jgi:hypothetical protein
MSKRRQVKSMRQPPPPKAPRQLKSKKRTPTIVGGLAQRIFEPRGPKVPKVP